MPAAAVIPAPIAYIKVVAVKMLVFSYMWEMRIFFTIKKVSNVACSFFFIYRTYMVDNLEKNYLEENRLLYICERH